MHVSVYEYFEYLINCSASSTEHVILHPHLTCTVSFENKTITPTHPKIQTTVQNEVTPLTREFRINMN